MAKTLSKTDRLLDEAKVEIEKGDNHYAKAADKIIAAMKADTTLSYREIAKRIGKSDQWCRRLVQSRTNATPESGEEFQVDWERGSHATTEEIEEGARKALADPAKRQKIFSGLSPTEQAEVGASAFQTQEAREAAANLDGQGKANLILARTEGAEDTKKRNQEQAAIYSRLGADEYYWREFKKLISPKFLSASKYLGQFDWTEERIAWMHEYGEGIRDAFFRIAAENAQMSEEDFQALLGEL